MQTKRKTAQCRRQPFQSSPIKTAMQRALTSGDHEVVREVAERAYRVGGRDLMRELYWQFAPHDLNARRLINAGFEGVGGWYR